MQSVLYGNPAHDIVRAARSLANAVARARTAGAIGDWSLQLGDCTPQPALTDADIETIRGIVGDAGGELGYTFFDANLGSAAGHNALAALSDSEVMLILNPDAQVAPDTIEVLAAALVDGVGVAEARQVPLEHPKTFAPGTGDTSWASTACAVTPRSVFDAVGGFDSETFFLYCDDVDYSWRVRLAGHRVVYEPAARVFHDKRLTLSGDWPASAAEIYYSAEAALMIAHKYSRPGRVRTLLKKYRSDGHEAPLRAVEEFERRRSEGRLPTPIDPRHSVSQFIKDNYAEHRF